MNSNNISKGVKLTKMYITTNAFIQVLGGIIFIALFVYLFNQAGIKNISIEKEVDFEKMYLDKKLNPVNKNLIKEKTLS